MASMRPDFTGGQQAEQAGVEPFESVMQELKERLVREHWAVLLFVLQGMKLANKYSWGEEKTRTSTDIFQ